MPLRVSQKRSVTVAGHRTSITLENAFWESLRHLAAERGLSVSALVAEIERTATPANLSSAIRVFVLEHYRARAAAAGVQQV